MFSRLSYTLRETWTSFRRNLTLTAAAIMTAAVSLLIFGLTLLMNNGFDNLLSRWEGGVEMIVFMSSGSQPDAINYVGGLLNKQQEIGVLEGVTYCDVDCSLAEAQRLLGGNPQALARLNADNIPTMFKVAPAESTDVRMLQQLKQNYVELQAVEDVKLAEEQIELIGKLDGFVNTYTTGLWITLMAASGLLIWNTIRTAMFARRREIEVMKLVGATDWFIRVPFMLEGLFQGLMGGILATASMHFVNWRWTESVKTFPGNSGMNALVASPGYEWQVSLYILLFGALVGMIGAGLAASRFLDV